MPASVPRSVHAYRRAEKGRETADFGSIAQERYQELGVNKGDQILYGAVPFAREPQQFFDFALTGNGTPSQPNLDLDNETASNTEAYLEAQKVPRAKRKKAHAIVKAAAASDEPYQVSDAGGVDRREQRRSTTREALRGLKAGFLASLHGRLDSARTLDMAM